MNGWKVVIDADITAIKEKILQANTPPKVVLIKLKSMRLDLVRIPAPDKNA